MDEDKRKALEAAGWAFGDAEDFLELTPDERAEVERRIAAGDLIDPPPEDLTIVVEPGKPMVIPAGTLKEGQTIRVVVTNDDRRHRDRVEEAAKRMSEAHRETFRRLAEDD